MTRRSTPAALAAIGIVLLAGARTLAIYQRVDAQKVPVERLIANLERKAAEEPATALHQVNLGRLHGMAYALKTEEVPAVIRPSTKESKEEVPWYGYEPKLIPYPNRPAPSAEAAAAANAHLKKAIAHYEKALEIDPDSLLARLGYGWMLDQSSDKKRAIEQYRRVIAQAWKTEQARRVRLPGQNFYTREAIDYLIPLLDPVADAAEIRELRERQEVLDRLPRAITPIAIPLRDGLSRRGGSRSFRTGAVRRGRLRHQTRVVVDPARDGLARLRCRRLGVDHIGASAVRQRELLAVLGERL